MGFVMSLRSMSAWLLRSKNLKLSAKDRPFVGKDFEIFKGRRGNFVIAPGGKVIDNSGFYLPFCTRFPRQNVLCSIWNLQKFFFTIA
jgi:hypothetical protein